MFVHYDVLFDYRSFIDTIIHKTLEWMNLLTIFYRESEKRSPIWSATKDNTATSEYLSACRGIYDNISLLVGWFMTLSTVFSFMAGMCGPKLIIFYCYNLIHYNLFPEFFIQTLHYWNFKSHYQSIISKYVSTSMYIRIK